jgi:hypothetical protein
VRVQKVRRIVDARGTQRRLILNMDCGHNISISELDVAAGVVEAQPTEYECRACPDPPPEDRSVEDAMDAFRTASFGVEPESKG